MVIFEVLRLSPIILLCGLLTIGSSGFSQETSREILSLYQDTAGAREGKRYVLIELQDSIPVALANAIQLAAVRKFSNQLFILDRHRLKAPVLGFSFAKKWVAVNDDWKYSPSVLALKASGEPNADKVYQFNCLLNELGFAEELLSKNEALRSSARILPEQKILTLQLSLRQVAELLLHNSAVIFIDRSGERPSVELGTPGFDGTLNKVNLVHQAYPNINGAGMHVSVKEDLFDTADIDLKGRQDPSPLASRYSSSHATAMATIIAGAGNSIHYAKGAAWAAQLSSSSYDNVLPDVDSIYRKQGITVQNHSYGTTIENNYGLNALAFDQSACNNPSLLHIFSVGNIGANTSREGNYTGIPGFANMTGNFKMAKNILTIGGVDSLGQIAPLSSRGPAYDGRVKPELVAFQRNGTSESAALVSGTAILLQQYYSALHANSPMPSTLTKAILINSSADLASPGPDFKTGYGNLNAIKAMSQLKEDKIFSGIVSQGGLQQMAIDVPANAALLSVTLAWLDTAATPLAPRALVNDLDLELSLPDSSLNWKPWVHNSAAQIDSLNLPASRMRDSLNNVERVTIENPPTGRYTINVRGFTLPAGQQPFYIAYGWDMKNEFKWTAPTKDDLLEAATGKIIRWENSYPGNGNLEYSNVLTNNWQPLVNNVDLKANAFYWTVPDTMDHIRFRMKIGNQYFYSDTLLVTRLLKPTTGYICGDSLQIYWNQLTNIAHYQLYQLGDKYMEPLFSVSDTMLVFNKRNLKDQYFAVAPILNNGLVAPKSYAFNVNQQGAGCYINSFFADRTGENALLDLTLGSTIGVSAIDFEKLTVAGYTSIIQLVNPGSLHFSYTKSPLMQGINYFRAKITLSNGQVIYSNPVPVYYAAPGKYIWLPNPVKRNNDLTLISADPDGEVVILVDAWGRTVLKQTIQSVLQPISTSTLQAGMYFYLIVKNGNRLASGKLLVL